MMTGLRIFRMFHFRLDEDCSVFPGLQALLYIDIAMEFAPPGNLSKRNLRLENVAHIHFLAQAGPTISHLRFGTSTGKLTSKFCITFVLLALSFRAHFRTSWAKLLQHLVYFTSTAHDDNYVTSEK